MGEDKNEIEKTNLKVAMENHSMAVPTAAGGCLLHKKQEPIEHKDFENEVRGMMDITALLDKASVILDLQVRSNIYLFKPL